MRVVSRKLPLPTVENCRDLGGIHTEQGRMVRPGLLVRSANLHDARHDDLETLAIGASRTSSICAPIPNAT